MRLRRTKDVRQVYDEGQSWKHPLLVLVARPNGLDLSRAAAHASILSPRLSHQQALSAAAEGFGYCPSARGANPAMTILAIHA